MTTKNIAPATVATVLSTSTFDLSTLDGCAAFVDACCGEGSAAKIRASKKSVRGRANELTALAATAEAPTEVKVVAQPDSDEVRVAATEALPAGAQPGPALQAAMGAPLPEERIKVAADQLLAVEEMVLAVAPQGQVGERTSIYAGQVVGYMKGVDPSKEDYYLGLAGRGQKRSWWSARVGILFSRRAKTLAARAGISLPSLPWRSEDMLGWAEAAMACLDGYRAN